MKRSDFIEKGLRRISYKFPPRNRVKKAAIRHEGEYAIKDDKDRSRIKYECAMCGLLYRNKEINMDHIHPVIPVEGWDNWDGFIERLFVDDEGWQVLCKACHQEKTNEENKERRNGD